MLFTRAQLSGRNTKMSLQKLAQTLKLKRRVLVINLAQLLLENRYNQRKLKHLLRMRLERKKIRMVSSSLIMDGSANNARTITSLGAQTATDVRK